MRVVEAGYLIIREPSVTKKIEIAARVCYKSEGLIKEGSDLKMISKLIERQHTAMLEHGSVAFFVDKETYQYVKDISESLETLIVGNEDLHRVYLRFTEGERYIISGNMRAWVESIRWAEERNMKFPIHLIKGLIENTNGMMSYLEPQLSNITVSSFGRYAEYIPDCSKLTRQERMVHQDITVIFTVDRGVTHELVRMRDCSFAQESTRYCNYANDKFGEEITVIRPCFWEEGTDNYGTWYHACFNAEQDYFTLLSNGAVPQQARDVLPTSVKADIVMTANVGEWRHILKLRAADYTGPAHPQMKEVMVPLLYQLKEEQSEMFDDIINPNNV